MTDNPDAIDPERALALAYAAPAARPALSALLALDDRLATILRTTREPMVGQMRLTWWHQALTALDEAPPPAEPVLSDLAAHVVPSVPGEMLATMIEGWEALLDAEITPEALATHATMRGGGLFATMAAIAGTPDRDLRIAGEGWALADLARHLSNPALADRARTMARAALATTQRVRWPAPARAIAALAQVARMDLAAVPRPHGHPARASRLLWLRLSGR